MLHQEPAEGAQEGGDAVGLVAGGAPDLTEDSEVGREVQNQSGRGALKGTIWACCRPWSPSGDPLVVGLGMARYPGVKENGN